MFTLRLNFSAKLKIVVWDFFHIQYFKIFLKAMNRFNQKYLLTLGHGLNTSENSEVQELGLHYFLSRINATPAVKGLIKKPRGGNFWVFCYIATQQQTTRSISLLVDFHHNIIGEPHHDRQQKQTSAICHLYFTPYLLIIYLISCNIYAAFYFFRHKRHPLTSSFSGVCVLCDSRYQIIIQDMLRVGNIYKVILNES